MIIFILAFMIGTAYVTVNEPNVNKPTVQEEMELQRPELGRK